MLLQRILVRQAAASLKCRSRTVLPIQIMRTQSSTDIESRQKAIETERVEREIKSMIAEELKNKKSFVYSMPAVIQPYLRLMRMDKPTGTLVILWPGVWSILAAAAYQNHLSPDYTMLAIFTVGAFAMRSAGCIINDIWDRKYDAQVERTKTRPMASGEIGLPGALALLGVNLSVSLYCLLQLNMTTQVLGACALFPVALYPATKRFSNWPQLFLGFAINWGALMGWTAILCNPSDTASQNIFSMLPALALYIGCINWTLVYDTLYAYQDKLYDQKLGLKSTTITLEKNPKKWLLGFATLSTSSLSLLGYLTNQEPIYYGFMALVYAHFLKQIFFVDLNSIKSCGKQFKSNNTIGILTALGFVASSLTH